MSQPIAETVRTSRRPGARALQAVGLVVGLALLAWAVRLALGPENREALERMRHAPASLVVALAGLTVLTVINNGLMFWWTLRPLRRVPAGETVGVNAIATFLSLLPFKLGLIVRSLVHVRRHGVSWSQLASWYAAFAGLTLGSLVLIGVASVAPRLTSAGRFAAAAGMLAVFGAGVVVVGRVAVRWRVFSKPFFADAFTIARDPAAVTGHIALRGTDVLIFGLRFYIAAKITGVVLSAGASLQLGGAYLFLTAVAPAGSLGFTELGTAKAGGLLGLDTGTVALLALVTTAAQGIVSGAMAVAAWLWIRPHALWKRGGEPAPTPASSVER
jgi:hypothetical protein